MEYLFSVKLSLEVKVERENTTIKRALKSFLMGVFPFSIYNTESYIFIRWAGMESYRDYFRVGRIFFNEVCWRSRFINEIRVEDIEP
jgi:hypothetical protein